MQGENTLTLFQYNKSQSKSFLRFFHEFLLILTHKLPVHNRTDSEFSRTLFKDPEFLHSFWFVFSLVFCVEDFHSYLFFTSEPEHYKTLQAFFFPCPLLAAGSCTQCCSCRVLQRMYIHLMYILGKALKNFTLLVTPPT